MKRNHLQLFTLCLTMFCVQLSYGQTLWPGDVNDNGVVNGIDVLYAGVAYGSSGALRPGASENWQAQTVTLWGQSFFDGIDYAYADCDGNGVVEEDDIEETIKDNFFLTHGVLVADEYSSGHPDNDPAVRLQVQNANLGIGETLIVDLWLGEENKPVQNFYGIALRLKYNPDFVLGTEEWEFEEIDNVWYDPTDNDSEKLLVVDEATGTMELAITRINQQSISGAGKIGEFSVIIEDIIFGLQADTLNLEIESIRMIDKDFNTLAVVADSTFVVISRPSGTATPFNNSTVHIFPNPAKNVITIRSDNVITGFEIHDINGRLIRNKERIQGQNKTINLSLNDYKLPPQLYLLKVFTREGVAIKKIILI